MEDVTPERWLPVVGYEGYYEVSDLGRVRSLTRSGSGGRGRKRMFQGRVLTSRLKSSETYLTVTLSRDGRHVDKRVHKLVTEAFFGPCPGREVCHGPNGAFDNSVSNLSYGTRAKNMADMLRDGTRVLGTRMYSAKLTEADVIEIRRRHMAGEAGYRVLAREYGVDQGQIRLIVKRKNWKHVA